MTEEEVKAWFENTSCRASYVCKHGFWTVTLECGGSSVSVTHEDRVVAEAEAIAAVNRWRCGAI